VERRWPCRCGDGVLACLAVFSGVLLISSTLFVPVVRSIVPVVHSIDPFCVSLFIVGHCNESRRIFVVVVVVLAVVAALSCAFCSSIIRSWKWYSAPTLTASTLP